MKITVNSEAAAMGIESSEKFSKESLTRWIALISLSVIISVLLYPGMLRKPTVYKIGEIAEEDIKATTDLLIQNTERTEKDREEARKNALLVYDFDPTASDIVLRLREAMTEARNSILIMSLDPSLPVPIEDIPVDSDESTREISENFFRLLELPYSEKLFKNLVELGLPDILGKCVDRLVTDIFRKGVVADNTRLMAQAQKGVVLQPIQSRDEILVKDLTRFYTIDSAKKAISAGKKELLEEKINPEIAEIAAGIAGSFIRPNVTFNKRETEIRRDKAEKAINPTLYKIKRGEMLVREGQRVGPEQHIKLLEEAKSIEKRSLFGRIPGTAVLMVILISVIYTTGFMKFKPLGRETRHVIFSSVTLLSIFLFSWTYSFVAEEIARGYHTLTPRALMFSMPLTFGVILITVFQGINMAVVFSLLISILASLVLDGNIEFLVYFFVSSLMASYLVREYRTRGILIKVGIQVGLLNILTALSIESINGAFFSFESLVSVVSAFMGGLLAGVISTGVIPLVEMAFGFTTDIKLLELANLDQPLLRDLMVRAPGTYHHSVIVSNMVEATAKAINANPLLAKVSAYYHDIGKMKKPLYFIENQMGGENRHEKLAPSMSSLVLISHVKDGVELAREHKLGPEIIDIIQQHQGKGLISFFYEKAKEQAAAKGFKAVEVKEEDYRYPGPKPQTKEAGLVMIADMVEAASRSLPDPTPARIQGTVQKIINKVFSDGQLDECELTLKDLHEIAKSFNKTLGGIFHQRVEYPEATTQRINKKTTDGNTDQNRQKDSRPKKSRNSASFNKGLKRLGM